MYVHLRNPLNWICFLLFGYAVYFLARGVSEILDFNDFEVFYMAGQLAGERSLELYTTRSPNDNRPFLYPPAAAILFRPLSLLSFTGAAVAFALLKTVALFGLLWGAIRWSGARPEWRGGWPLLMLIPLFIAFRYVQSDMGNGQVNILVAALTLWGVALVMEDSRGWARPLAGSALWAIAVAIKATPLLLLAVPVVALRWGRSAVMSGCVLMTCILLPVMWWGAEDAMVVNGAFSDRSERQILQAVNDDRQISLSEWAMFTAGQLVAHPDLVFDEDRKINRVVDGELSRDMINPPFTHEQARLIWFAIGLGVGVVWLVGRWWIRRRGGNIDWTWDMATLFALTLLLSPLVRKAHLVAVIVPIGWMAARFAADAAAAGAHGTREVFAALWNKRRGAFVAFVMASVLFWLSEDWPLPSPGPLPYHMGILVALLALLGALTLYAITDRCDVTES